MIEESSAPMRLCARGPSGTLTASTPAAFKARHCANIGAGSTPRGGTISTVVTSWPAASLAPKHDRLASGTAATPAGGATASRSEEHTSELQSLAYLVCRLLLEKKK